MKSISKLTAKLILGSVLKGYEDTERTEYIRIAGRIDKVIIKPSSLNPENTDVKLIGEFVATNVQTGEQFTSATLHPMGAAMSDMMQAAESGSMFALRVFLQPSTRTPLGYAFDFESAAEVKPSDAVQRMNDVFLALPPPAKAQEKKEEKKEDVKNTGKKK